jgi:hypothetical protein
LVVCKPWRCCIKPYSLPCKCLIICSSHLMSPLRTFIQVR